MHSNGLMKTENNRAALAESVDFQARAGEAAQLLEQIVTRMLAADGVDRSAASDRAWSLDECSFHGAVEVPLPLGARAVVTVSPKHGIDETNCRTYRAAIAVIDVGKARPSDLAPKLSLGRFMPFTDTETEKIRTEMPLTRHVPALFQRSSRSTT